MSRSKAIRLFQIEVLDFNRPPDLSGKSMERVGHGLQNQHIVKQADRLPVLAGRRTLFKWAKTKEAAERRAKHFGTVISCFKVDSGPYKQNIEHLNIAEKPIPIVLEEEFTVGRDLSISMRPDKGFQVEIDK